MAATLAEKVGVCYLAERADLDWKRSHERFLASYEQYPAGLHHTLYVLHKSAPNDADRDLTASLFRRVAHVPLFVSDEKSDVGAHLDAVPVVAEERLCLLNTDCELVSENWLTKLAVNLEPPDVGAVGASGSFESRHGNDGAFPEFPNIHLRLNAFMIDREVFCSIASVFDFGSRMSAMLFESGPESMTRRLRARGLEVLVVGRNGRGHSPRWWPHSETFHQGTQSNLLIADDQTRNYDAAVWREKRELAQQSWGIYLQETNSVPIPNVETPGGGRTGPIKKPGG